MSRHEAKHAALRWAGIQRDYTTADVDRLRGSVRVEHTLARLGAERLWHLLQQLRERHHRRNWRLRHRQVRL